MTDQDHCLPTTRCIICSECEAKIVERERERCARVAEKHISEHEEDAYQCDMDTGECPGRIAQAILRAE